jgi:hypothetical protein
MSDECHGGCDGRERRCTGRHAHCIELPRAVPSQQLVVKQDANLWNVNVGSEKDCQDQVLAGVAVGLCASGVVGRVLPPRDREYTKMTQLRRTPKQAACCVVHRLPAEGVFHVALPSSPLANERSRPMRQTQGDGTPTPNTHHTPWGPRSRTIKRGS